MGRPAKDITGSRSGKLVAIRHIGSNEYKQAVWLCRCDCGNEIECRGTLITQGFIKSCGCSSKPTDNRRNKKNAFKNMGDYTLMTDVKGNCTQIDTEDVDNIKEYYWHKAGNGYWVHHSRKHGQFSLHRFVMDAPDDMLVDHRYHDLDDNRKSMLRVCTDQQNQLNRTPKKRKEDLPVGIYQKGRKYKASLRLKQIELNKTFNNLQDAIAQRKEWEKQYCGEYAFVR